MNNDKDQILSDFCDDIINGSGGFKVWERHELVTHLDRDVAIVSWVLRCLANTNCPNSEYVLKLISEKRLKQKA